MVWSSKKGLNGKPERLYCFWNEVYIIATKAGQSFITEFTKRLISVDTMFAFLNNVSGCQGGGVAGEV